MRISLGLPLLLLAPVGLAGPLAGQAGPPAPLPFEEFELPAFEEGVLANGARVLVVPRHELPLVSVSLVLPGGAAAGPADLPGLAELTAGLLTKGTATRSADEIEEAVDFQGAQLGAIATPDWTSVTLETVTSALPEMLGLMADVVLRPSFPEEELELLRTRAISGLTAALAQPATLAERAFQRTVYGEHPYGRLPTPESLRRLDRASVVAFHEAWYRPDEALFVVAGDVGLEEATGLLEAAFSEWRGGEAPPLDPPPPPSPTAPRVTLVHQPGAVQAVVRMGHLVAVGDDSDWTPLSTLNQVLGGGPAGRLFRILREERGLTYAAYSQAERRLGPGFFRASAEGRTEVAGQIVEEMLAQIVRVRDESVPPEELGDAQAFLVGSFPLQVETPQQLADVLTMGRIYGLPDSALTTYRERVAALSPEDLREVAGEHLHPEALSIVVVGDAVTLQPRLRTFGEVSVVDAEGRPVELAELLPQGRSIPLDASALAPTEVAYAVSFQGTPVGSLARTLEAGDEAGTMVYRGTADLGPQRVSQSVTFTVPGFEARGADARIEASGQVTTLDVEVRDGRMVGRVEGPAGAGEVDRPVPDGAVVGDMVELVLWLADLEEGAEFSVPLVQVETGAVHNVPYRVTGIEEVTVPAGTFEAFRVEMGGPQPQTAWARAEAPHVLVRVEPSGQPVAIELTSMGGGGPR